LDLGVDEITVAGRFAFLARLGKLAFWLF